MTRTHSASSSASRIQPPPVQSSPSSAVGSILQAWSNYTGLIPLATNALRATRELFISGSWFSAQSRKLDEEQFASLDEPARAVGRGEGKITAPFYDPKGNGGCTLEKENGQICHIYYENDPST